MIHAYRNADSAVLSWFGGAWDNDGLAAWADEQRHRSWNRPALVQILNQSADSYHASPASRTHIKMLADNDCFAIVTGQQPAVGGGPLYTLIKAAHAIATAKEMRARGKKVVPIFWCASEDHDEGEANHADFISENGQVHRYTSNFEQTGASSRYQRVHGHWQGLLEACQQYCGSGLGTDFMHSLQPSPEESLGTWQCRLLSAVFADEGLICLEPYQLRPLWHDKIPHIIARWPHLALAQQRSTVLDHGYSDSFNGLLSKPPLFADRPDGRTAISDDVAGQSQSWARNLHLNDHSISCGAALRPIIQQVCLPAMAYVGGPGELHYHAFLAPIYHTLNVPMPRFIPRQSFTLIPAWLRRQLAQWQLSASDIHKGMTAPTLPAALSQDCINSILTALEQESALLPQHDHASQQRIRSGIKKIHSATSAFAASMQRHQRQRESLPPFAHLHDFIFPKGKAQERVMSCTQALSLYGSGIGRCLVDACSHHQPHHIQL